MKIINNKLTVKGDTMKKAINVLSLFNGMSFCSMALESLGVNVNRMYSSEIDKYANQATQALSPDTTQLGDVTKWREWDIDWAGIDLVTGGFPCQAWSMAGKQLGDKDERGMLFWTMLDIMKHVKCHNPKADFLIENVKMKKEFEQYITTHTENALGKVYKVLINSALVSAQNRNRYYWTNFEVEQPEDKGVSLKDILEDLPDCPVGISVRDKSKCVRSGGRNSPIGDKHEWGSPFQRLTKKGSLKKGIEKAACLTGGANSGGNHSDMDIIHSPLATRRYSVRECFRLQTVPEHHIDTLLNAGISNTQLYKMCGNGWTMEVIKHIFKAMINES